MRLTAPLRSIKTVVCGISGGVDSAVSALILKRKGYDVVGLFMKKWDSTNEHGVCTANRDLEDAQYVCDHLNIPLLQVNFVKIGYDVVGLFMKNWDSTNEHGVCTADRDLEDAQYVCDHLNIPLLQVNFVKEYWNDVFCAFLDDLQKGRTPNPDILCNKYIKFNAFHNYAIDVIGADAIATGHYARTSAGYDLDSVDDSEGVDLLEAVDQSKCQTLFLSQISQSALRRALFPVGDLLKSDVKKIAKEYGLDKTAQKRESMGICFIGKRNFHEFIEEYMEPQPGKFIHLETGEVLGEHKGVHYWTLGQRALLSGMKDAMYIAEKNLETNDILVTPTTEPPHWINKPPRELLTDQMFDSEFKYQNLIKFEEKVKCTSTLSGGNSLIVSLETPRRCVCPGQYAVFHRGGACLGSAKVRRSGPNMYTLGQREHFLEYGEWLKQSSAKY